MKKLTLSLIGAIIISLFITSSYMDYDNSGKILLNYHGIKEYHLREFDVVFIGNAISISLVVFILIICILKFLEKHKK
ncbi:MULTISPECIES: hypothetical protein [Bacillus]|uniref:hypothetical protein n=1 Tax=Bacillus TaxID=1386 RepID=UPI0002DD5598|nr:MULTISPECIES: hypothetical protein [Bacillus]